MVAQIAKGSKVKKNETSAETEGPPETDAEIQVKYEAALGKFLVAFNRIENAASDIIILALKQADREDLHSISISSFAQKILYLELISLRFSEIASKSLVIELKALGAERNNLAHGHFDMSPIDNSYAIITKKRQRLDMPVTKMRTLTERAEKAFQQLRTFEAHYWFEEPEPS